MNCLVVGDKISCKQLEEFATQYSSINLIGAFTNFADAMNLLGQRQDVDLVFVDITLTGIESLDFLENLKNPPNIIVVSSTNEHALKAFDYKVVDFLHKPVSYARFCRAVDKTFRYFLKRENSITPGSDIFIKKGTSLIKLKPKDIIYVEALENYVTLITNMGKHTIHFTMKGIENQLPSDVFFRVHRSYIVNKDNIKTIKEDSLDLVIDNEITNIPVGKSFRDYFLNQMNVMNR